MPRPTTPRRTAAEPRPNSGQTPRPAEAQPAAATSERSSSATTGSTRAAANRGRRTDPPATARTYGAAGRPLSGRPASGRPGAAAAGGRTSAGRGAASTGPNAPKSPWSPSRSAAGSAARPPASGTAGSTPATRSGDMRAPARGAAAVTGSTARSYGQADRYPRVVSLAHVRAMARRARQRASRRTGVILAVCLVVTVLLGYLFLFSPVLAVKKFQLIGGDRFGMPQLQAIADPELGTPLARVDLADLQRKIAAEPAVKSAQVVRVWPNTLEVRVSERTPVLVVPVVKKSAPDATTDSTSSKAQGYQLVAGDGVVIETVAVPPENLPTVSDDTVIAGKAAVIASAEVMQALPDALRSEVTQVSASSRDSVQLSMTLPALKTPVTDQKKGKKTSAATSSKDAKVVKADRKVTVVWGGVDDSALKAEVLAVLLQTEAKVYDVSSPSTPVTRDAALPAPSTAGASQTSTSGSGTGTAGATDQPSDSATSATSSGGPSGAQPSTPSQTMITGPAGGGG